ncbi:MAG: hypothetical protein IPG04_24305 [Polyangiaceae bacterium]|nr:hypothetical protein [Polyangiaceae bacterium]
MSMRTWAWVLAAALGTVACGDDGSGASGGGGAGGEGGGEGGAPPACAAETLCMDVVPAGAPAPGRLGVVWFRFEGTVGFDPTVAFDAPFDTTSTEIELPLSEIGLPPDVNLFCDRECEDTMTCPCVGTFRAGVAYVLVVTDVDASGAIDVAELAEPDNLVGIANTAVVWGSQESPIAPAPFDDIFPAGVHDGLDLHRITEGGAFEPAPEGVRFELRAGAGAL